MSLLGCLPSQGPYVVRSVLHTHGLCTPARLCTSTIFQEIQMRSVIWVTFLAGILVMHKLRKFACQHLCCQFLWLLQIWTATGDQPGIWFLVKEYLFLYHQIFGPPGTNSEYLVPQGQIVNIWSPLERIFIPAHKHLFPPPPPPPPCLSVPPVNSSLDTNAIKRLHGTTAFGRDASSVHYGFFSPFFFRVATT